MKVILIILVLTVNVKSGYLQICYPWPEDLSLLRDCCNTPFHYNSVLLEHCYLRCRSSRGDYDQNECATKCYANYTLLVNDDGKLNKNVAKRIYNGNAGYDTQWTSVIEESVDSCEYEDLNSLTEALASFYECVNQKLADNCVKFANTRNCDKVEEYFEKCKNIEPDCDAWPENLINPEGCCRTVPLFNRELTQACRKECATKEFYEPRQLECTDSCLFNGVKTDEKFDFDEIKSLLLKNSKKNTNWKKPIENAVEECAKKIKEIEDSNTNDEMRNRFLLTCLRDMMSEECVDFMDNPNCNKVKRFLLKCPTSRPKRLRI